MIAITVDDEKLMLTALTKSVLASPDITSVEAFSTCSPALEWIKNHPVDIAFLDISMRGMGGLALAEKITEVQPNCNIVFCTGFSQYAVEAFRLHASGYLMKPVTVEGVQREIDHIKGTKEKEKLLTIRCFGYFEVFFQGEALRFKRSRSKELLAVLVDRKGAGMTAKQICAVMWPESDGDVKSMNYLHQLFCDLRNALGAAHAEEILQQNGYYYSLDKERVDCDYYSFLKTGRPEFHGEYMTQYSWAEETCALLWK